jgi:hypothetical protein
LRKKIITENKNLKKMLCHNMIMTGECRYRDKCLYAHNLSEQNMDVGRKIAYDILSNNNNLSHINLQKNHTIYRSLFELTKMCEQCDKHKCTGGYNCKFGACSKKYHICLRDLNYGDCPHKCGCVHLSTRGLVHFYNSFVKTANINGTLLTSEFFKTLCDEQHSECEKLSNMSDESEHDNLSNDCDQSIFEKIKIVQILTKN